MSDLIYGFGDEVLISATLLLMFIVPLCIYLARHLNWRRSFNFLMFWQRAGEDERADVPNRPATFPPDDEVHHNHRSHPDRCPICLQEYTLPLETNCGHMFCGGCVKTYLSHLDTFPGSVPCPMCRQQITMLFVCFTNVENQVAADSALGKERDVLYNMATEFNRRFSDIPRPLMDMLRDWPTLMRHLWNEFFSMGGLVYMFRIRIVLCFLAGCMYLISPLDVFPEAMFGVLGLLDDVFVVFLLAIYVSVLYRQILVSRGFGLGL